ncbi:MAG: dipeptidyl-peptidase 3 family protein [Spirochaetota bacterium]
MNYTPEFVPYRQKDEPPRRAGIIKVEVPLEEMSDNQLQLIGHLNRAADEMNNIFVQQCFEGTTDIADMLRKLRRYLAEQEQKRLDEYLTILHLQNCPWTSVPRKNHLLQIEPERLERAAEQAGETERLQRYRDFLFDEVELSKKAEFYPDEMTEEQLQQLGDEGLKVNTVIRKKQNEYVAIRNEELFREACERAAGYLAEARKWSEDPEFTIYLDAKIEELRTGSDEARRLADYHWVRHSSPVDIIISTALEVYVDGWQNAKGAACSGVLTKNTEMDSLLQQFVKEVPQWERNAPWKWKRTEINPNQLPKLKFVDVWNWTGDYVSSPLTVLAQSLPNDEWVGKHIGTVNMVYKNTGDAVHAVRGDIMANEFLPRRIVKEYMDVLFYGDQVHATLHEIGHTTGRQDPDHPEQPSVYLKDEYSILEETRAELFGMWASEQAVKAGIISQQVADACQFSMVISMVNALKFKAEQAHNIARNMIFHFLKEQGTLQLVKEDGKNKVALDLEKTHHAVEQMLAMVGDIKSSGDREAAVQLREKYCFEDSLKAEIEARTQKIPLGTGIIFPVLKNSEGGFIREIEYPEFTQQAKFSNW